MLALTPLLYLVPLPAAWLADQGARAFVAAPAHLLDLARPAWTPLSLDPPATLAVALNLLPALAVFLATRHLDATAQHRLLQLLLALALAQGLLGLLQFASAQSGSHWLAVTGPHAGSAQGTFANRNHLAVLVNLLLPWALLRTLAPPAPARAPDLRYAAVTAALLVTVLATRSRTGITLALAGLVLASALGASAWPLRRRVIGVGLILGGALLVMGVIGLAPVLARFALPELLADSRPQILATTLAVLQAWWPLGSGPGTYALVLAPAQPATLPEVLINHAHNDYLEFSVETGVLGVALLGTALWLFGQQSLRLWRHAAGQPPLGAGLGLLLMALHELVDYGLQIPLNQVVFAFLAGVFFFPRSAPSRAARRRVP